MEIRKYHKDGGGYLWTDGGGYLWTDGGGYLWTDRHGQVLKTLACLKMGKKDQEEKEEMDEEEKETMTFVGWLGDKVNNYNKWKLQKRKGVTKGGEIDQNNAITDGCVAPLTMLLTIVIMYHKILSF